MIEQISVLVNELLIYHCDRCEFDTIVVSTVGGRAPAQVSCRRGGSIEACDGTALHVESPDPLCLAEDAAWEWVPRGTPRVSATENAAVATATYLTPLELRSRQPVEGGRRG